MNLVGVFRAEWLKLWSVWSTLWSLLTAAVVTVAIGMFAVFASELHMGTPASKTGASLSGFQIGQLAVCVLGVLVATSEYSTGLIRVTLAATPRRGRLYAGKALVVAAVSALAGWGIGFGAFAAGQSVLGFSSQAASLADAGVLRALLGVGGYSALLGLFAFALGVLIRSSAGAITTLVGVLFLGPLLVLVVELSTQDKVLSTLWPTLAGAKLMRVEEAEAWSGGLIFAAWTAALLLAGHWALKYRDA